MPEKRFVFNFTYANLYSKFSGEMNHKTAKEGDIHSLIKRMENTNKKRLISLVERITDRKDGIFETGLKGVSLIRISEKTPRYQIIYQPSIVLIAQGAKKGFLGADVYTYDADHYIVLSVPLPFESQIIEAGPATSPGLKRHRIRMVSSTSSGARASVRSFPSIFQ